LKEDYSVNNPIGEQIMSDSKEFFVKQHAGAAPDTLTVKASSATLVAPSPATPVAKKVTAEDVKAHYQALLQSSLDKALHATQAESAELPGWWDILAFGPIQPILNPPFRPSDVIRAGETAYIVTVLILNPFPILPPGISPCDILSKFALPYEITYQTGNVTTWTKAPAPLTSEKDPLYLVPGQCYYVDVLEFTPQDKDEVMYEMNISARIFGCNRLCKDGKVKENYAPPFAGFAREVVEVDSSFFKPAPFLNSSPIRFLVYGDQPGEA
jgi:hypothetical protein